MTSRHTFSVHQSLLFGVLLVLGGATLFSTSASAESLVELTVRQRDQAGVVIEKAVSLDPAKSAVVVIDMWDRHWCKTYTERVGNLVPRMNDTLAAARKLGIQVVFAPSDTTDFYKDSPQRKAMQAIPQHPAPKTIGFQAPRPPGPTDHCECGPDEPCGKGRAWSRQHPELKIEEGDLIGDCNNGGELLRLCREREIDTLLYMGVASNMCVQYRSFGIRNMKNHGLRVIVVRDLVEAITANGIGPDGKPDPNFTPAKGSSRVERHIEQHIAATVESRQLIQAAGMSPKDGRQHIVFVVAEQEYGTGETLPTFAKKYLDKEYRYSFCFARGDTGAERNDVPGLEAVYDADLLVLSMRRRALPVTQMDHLERYIRSGKPLVGIRTSVVPFQVHEPVPAGHVGWSDFDREVLKCHYQGYDARSRETGCDVAVAPDAQSHPAVRQMASTKFHSASWPYRMEPVADAVTVLMAGRWSEDEPAYPVAWTATYNGGRVFFTTLGHPSDFKNEAFNELLLGGIRWTLDSSGRKDE
ncbi:MAG: isochorismatase family protein [Pirellulaceae bacterium]|nr:isochorismatase family protein [Pirellulaceae bacterium]